MGVLTGAEALQGELDGLALIGRKILSMGIRGELFGFDHQHMLDVYNNCLAPEGGPYRKPDDAVFEDEIPLDLEQTRMVSTEDPIFLVLDDGRTVDIAISGFSEAAVSVGSTEGREKNRLVDVDKVMAPILGERISAVAVHGMEENAYERHYVEDASDPFKCIRVDCEDHSLYFSYPTCTVMRNAPELEPLGMTMGELKDAVSYYSELFDSRP